MFSAYPETIESMTAGNADAKTAVVTILSHRLMLATTKKVHSSKKIPTVIKVSAGDDRMRDLADAVREMPTSSSAPVVLHIELVWEASARELAEMEERVLSSAPSGKDTVSVAVSMFPKGAKSDCHLMSDEDVKVFSSFAADPLLADMSALVEGLATAREITKILRQIEDSLGETETGPVDNPVTEEQMEKVSGFLEKIGIKTEGGVEKFMRDPEARKEAFSEEASPFAPPHKKKAENCNCCLCSFYLVTTPEGKKAVVNACHVVPFAAFTVIASRYLAWSPDSSGIAVKRVTETEATMLAMSGIEFYEVKE